MDDPISILLALAVAGYFFRTWLQDFSTKETEGALPGAKPVGLTAVMVAIAGALVILGAEVCGEYALGVVQEQTDMTILLGIYTLAAAFSEELIFRGFLFYDKGSKGQLVGSIIITSAIFALIHPYIWHYEMSDQDAWWQIHRWLSLDLTTKALLSTGIVFLNSLWFYYVRFFQLNPLQSLIPCIAAHFASNLGVFLIKALQGKVSGLY